MTTVACTELEASSGGDAGIVGGRTPLSGGGVMTGGSSVMGGATLQSGGITSSGGAAASTGGVIAATGGVPSSGGGMAVASGGIISTGGTATGGTSATGGDATGGTTRPPGPTLACAASLLVDRVEVSTAAVPDSFSGSCGPGDSADAAFEWVAPATDWYQLDTRGSDFDTVLYLLDACDGDELACNDNDGEDVQSSIVRRFNAGERVLAVVDGKVGSAGSAVLNANVLTCPGQELSGQPLPVQLSTVGGPDMQVGACSSQGFAERSYRWTPEVDGLYRFSAKSDVFSPAIYLERGPVCGGQTLACNRGAAGGYQAEVTRFLSANQPVTVIVDGVDGQGIFELDIEPIPGAACPSHDWDDWSEKPVIKPPDANVLSGSCAPAGGMTFSGLEGHSEHSYPQTVELAPGAGCSLTMLGSAPFTMYILRGGVCGGEEVFCANSSADSSGEASATWGFFAKDNGEYTLVVESPQMYDLTYDYRVQCVL